MYTSMKITDIIKQHKGSTLSFEVLPPLKGTGIEKLFRDIDILSELNPSYLNITTHRSESVYRDLGGGLMQRTRLRRRPGTVAVAAAIQQRYNLPVVPHILCSGFSREETEYVLLDLQFLGISNLLLLRGDKAREDRVFTPDPDGYSHTTELQGQINRFNEGYFVDGDPIKVPGIPFSYGVACYPEKHEEAPNLDEDFRWFKQKVDNGAEYAVTQLFYDNSKYLAFVDRAHKANIDIPIIPGIKPLSKKSQITMVPKTFHCDLPHDLATEALKCKNDAEVSDLGVEWCVAQCKELLANGAPGLHFYTVSAVDSIRRIVKELF